MSGQTRLFTVRFVILCAITAAATLFYTYCHHHSSYYDALSDENLFIEQTLQHIPTCTLHDRSQQRALLHTLLQWAHFAQQHHITYSIAYTTLLSYVHHHHSLLPHISYIDLFIMAHDTSTLFELSHLNLSSTHTLRVHPQWYLTHYAKRSYFSSENIDFIEPNARFVSVKDHVYINLWPVYPYNPNDTRIDKNNTRIVAIYDKNYEWKSVSKDWIYPLDECEYSGMKVWCPSQAEKVLDAIYGQRSVNTSLARCMNGSWIISNEVISMEKNISTKQSTTIYSTVSTNTKSADVDPIERAVEQIPTCTPFDHFRHRSLLTTLQAWANLTENYHLQYWISFGSLVGYVQRRGLLPHDSDIDVSISAEDTAQLIRLSQLNFSSDYEIRVQPQWDIVGYQNRSYHYGRGINFISPNARFVYRKVGHFVDIWPAYNFNPNDANSSIKGKQLENLTEYSPAYTWYTYPRSWVYPLQTCYFSSIKVLCPAEPEKLVQNFYGTAALTKSDKKCANGSWVKNI